MFSINFKGTVICYKAAAKVMIDQKRGGRIIGVLRPSSRDLFLLLICIGASSNAGKKGMSSLGSCHSIHLIFYRIPNDVNLWCNEGCHQSFNTVSWCVVISHLLCVSMFER